LFTTGGGVLRERVSMRYRAIQGHDRRVPIRLMCRALALSAAGYDAWCNGTSFGLNELEALVTVACDAKEWIAAHVLKR